jgi:transcriptional regulator with XRE-family HTH domain
MTDSLNPETLKALRKSRAWSQTELAAESGISKSQIGRWEGGQQIDNVRGDSRERLCAALGVKWEVLTRPPKLPSAGASGGSELKLNVPSSTLTALELVGKLYRVRREVIVELAPLLFLLTAQTSLERRRGTLQEAVEGVEKAIQDAITRVPGLGLTLSIGSEDSINEEAENIEKRRVFDSYEGAEETRSFYTDYLNALLDDLPDGVISRIPGKPIEDISPGYGTGAPHYSFSTALVERGIRVSIPEIDSLAESAERLSRLVKNVAIGDPDLRTLTENRRTMSDDTFKEWIGPFLEEPEIMF